MAVIRTNALGETNIPKVRQLNKRLSHHGRQISEIGTETGLAEAIEGQQRESEKAGADHVATGDEGEAGREQEKVEAG
jgi:hypothetical protein